MAKKKIPMIVWSTDKVYTPFHGIFKKRKRKSEYFKFAFSKKSIIMSCVYFYPKIPYGDNILPPLYTRDPHEMK